MVLDRIFPIEALPEFMRLINIFNEGLAYEMKIYETSDDHGAFVEILEHLKKDLPGYIKNYEFWMQCNNLIKSQQPMLKEFEDALSKAKHLIAKASEYSIAH
jgi:hypothetical protein